MQQYTWHRAYGTPQHTLILRTDGATLITKTEHIEQTKHIPIDALSLNELIAIFDLMAVAEILGMAHMIMQNQHIAKPTETFEEPVQVARFFGKTERGVQYPTAHIHGRHVFLNVPEHKQVRFDLKNIGHHTQQVLDALGETEGKALIEAATTLMDRTCMCATGCKTIDEHGSFKSLSRIQHPQAPIEHVASCGQCTVCKRLWTFEMAGDPHYSYHYNHRQFSTT